MANARAGNELHAHFQEPELLRASRSQHQQEYESQQQPPYQYQHQLYLQQHRRNNSAGESAATDTAAFNDSGSIAPQLPADFIPRHSDYTIPTSNVVPKSDSPPPEIELPLPKKMEHAVINGIGGIIRRNGNGNGNGRHHRIDGDGNGNDEHAQQERNGGRRTVFPSNVGKKYVRRPPAHMQGGNGGGDHMSSIDAEHDDMLLPLHGVQLPQNHSLVCDDSDMPSLGPPVPMASNSLLVGGITNVSIPYDSSFGQMPSSPPPPPPTGIPLVVTSDASSGTPTRLPNVSPLTPHTNSRNPSATGITPRRLSKENHRHRHNQHRHHHRRALRNSSTSSSIIVEPDTPVHETIHAQSLMLGLAFLAIWSPNNIMAPNLTQMAIFFDMDELERDLYLGSYCALAVGVLSLPISAVIGILADFYSRKHLFVACVAGGALSSIATALSPNFPCLMIARLLSGGCMSGSVPVAFSLLGDLFTNEERNAASSGLTAMMGLGILSGQVYAGVTGNSLGWAHPFYMSSLFSFFCMLIVLALVREPARGGKEKVLQEMIKSGTKYDRKLSWKGFVHAMSTNRSNGVLMWQGYFSSLPWGIIFVFLNDYLSQEKGFSVPDATFVVMLFGIGCALGGILGGYWGQILLLRNKAYLPLFMAATTFAGIVPFLALLNSTFPNAHGFLAMFYSVMGGLIASLPSVNVRPCLINVNPPETRGAALTAANLIINLARGTGPSCITLMDAIWGANRQLSFNVTLVVFWTVSAFQLLLLAKYLPEDQENMEAELAQYAETMKRQKYMSAFGPEGIIDELARKDGEAQLSQEVDALLLPSSTPRARTVRNSSIASATDSSVLSLDERILYFDNLAARESIEFVQKGLQEVADEVRHFQELHHCHMPQGIDTIDSDSRSSIDEGSEDDDDVEDNEEENDYEQQRRAAGDNDVKNERTPLL